MPINYDRSIDNEYRVLSRQFNSLVNKLDRSARMTNSQDRDSQAFKKIVDTLHDLQKAVDNAMEALKSSGSDDTVT